MVFYTWRHFCLIERHLTVWSLSVSSHLCEAFKIAAAIYPTVTLFVIGARSTRRRGTGRRSVFATFASAATAKPQPRPCRAEATNCTRERAAPSLSRSARMATFRATRKEPRLSARTRSHVKSRNSTTNPDAGRAIRAGLRQRGGMTHEGHQFPFHAVSRSAGRFPDGVSIRHGSMRLGGNMATPTRLAISIIGRSTN